MQRRCSKASKSAATISCKAACIQGGKPKRRPQRQAKPGQHGHRLYPIFRRNPCRQAASSSDSTPFGEDPSITPIMPRPCSVSATITSRGLAVAQKIRQTSAIFTFKFIRAAAGTNSAHRRQSHDYRSAGIDEEVAVWPAIAAPQPPTVGLERKRPRLPFFEDGNRKGCAAVKCRIEIRSPPGGAVY